ncbi:LysR family transcriptional regulator [Rhodobaculum claviforme]|uniref:LysR family transcriptional regulator n=1 Tax=Rhodobaculum claviforme TaxID=1549854 RepID=A0A934TJ69_9RHOB|nr:LysR family transcriptional regulator [Rhodobaculum claviforme]MBK5926187.1 LysR family transcriptional regulator [Rhodobaculum claviforme]
MAGFDSWDEIRIAYHVARAGTVSGAADMLGVHHATVIRHVDALEGRLGLRLFQRHARGYTPTEAGTELLSVARATDEQFAQLAARLGVGGTDVAGDLTITAIPELTRFLAPALIRFQAAHPGVVVRLMTDPRVFRLEYGEAHLAIRAGPQPEEPDNVVQPFGRIRHALWAAPAYVAAHGLPAGAHDLEGHRFVGAERADSPVASLRWLAAHVPASAITFRGSDLAALEEAVIAGAGLGFLPPWRTEGMVAALPARPEWEAPLWLVTHVDLHRSAKVQAVLAHLKACAEEWPIA